MVDQCGYFKITNDLPKLRHTRPTHTEIDVEMPKSEKILQILLC